jgi:selenium metabolism protein YedF
MSESNRSIDARGLACPEPVVLTKKALAEGGFDTLDVVVDTPSACENVTRYATHAGFAVELVSREGDKASLRIRPQSKEGNAGESPSALPRSAPEKPETPDADRAATVFISSDKIGSGDDELGALLMRGFISTLVEAEKLPKRIIFMNSGVRLAIGGSTSLEKLALLADLGVEILACGTCLDFFHIKEKLAVGRVSNMFEISGFLLEGPTLSL